MKGRLCADWQRLNGLLVSRNGMSAPSLTVLIIPAPRAFWHKRGGKFLVRRRRRSCSRFFPIKICVTSAKRLRRLRSHFFCRKSAVNAAPIPKSYQKSCPTFTPQLPCSITPTVGDALMLARAKPNPILITGSLHFAGEVLAHLRGEPAAFEECAQ